MYWQIPSPFSPTLTSHFLLISLIYHHHHIGSYNCLGINFVRLTIYVVSGEGINFDKVSICYVFCCLLDDPWWYVEEKNLEIMKGFLQYLFCLCVCGLHGTSFDLGTYFWGWVILGTWEKNTLKNRKMPIKSVKMEISKNKKCVFFSCPKDHSTQKLGS